MIVRYDFNRGRWAHSSGVVLNANEAAVMSYLAHAFKNGEIGRMACMSEANVQRIIHCLRTKFNVKGAETLTRHQLIRIASDLFI